MLYLVESTAYPVSFLGPRSEIAFRPMKSDLQTMSGNFRRPLDYANFPRLGNVRFCVRFMSVLCPFLFAGRGGVFFRFPPCAA